LGISEQDFFTQSNRFTPDIKINQLFITQTTTIYTALNHRRLIKTTAILLLSIGLASCEPKSTEELVSELVESVEWKKQRQIGHELSNRLEPQAVTLINQVYSKNKTTYFKLYESMLNSYAKKFNGESLGMAKACMNGILGVDNLNNGPTQSERIALLLGLWQKSTANTLLDGYLKEQSLDHQRFAIESFLTADGATKKVYVELIARIGSPAVNDLKVLMKSGDRDTRFAAAEVLVLMKKYNPDAISNLIDAIDNSDLKLIANNYPFYVRLGIEGTEAILIRTLDQYFNTTMGLDLLNCGNIFIETETERIAKKHGYIVTRSVGAHSGPKWGSSGL
jgi:hypothetical protein